MPAHFPLRSCHSRAWSIVKMSGTQFQNYPMMKESVSLLSLPAFRGRSKREAAASCRDSKLRVQCRDQNVGIPNPRGTAAPCTHHGQKPWAPQEIQTRARLSGSPRGDCFPSGILHDLLLQTACEVLPSGYLLSQFSSHFAYTAQDSSRYLFSTSFNISPQ